MYLKQLLHEVGCLDQVMKQRHSGQQQQKYHQTPLEIE